MHVHVWWRLVGSSQYNFEDSGGVRRGGAGGDQEAAQDRQASERDKPGTLRTFRVACTK